MQKCETFTMISKTSTGNLEFFNSQQQSSTTISVWDHTKWNRVIKSSTKEVVAPIAGSGCLTESEIGPWHIKWHVSKWTENLKIWYYMEAWQECVGSSRDSILINQITFLEVLERDSRIIRFSIVSNHRKLVRLHRSRSLSMVFDIVLRWHIGSINLHGS
jgi:hypothetical protein